LELVVVSWFKVSRPASLPADSRPMQVVACDMTVFGV